MGFIFGNLFRSTGPNYLHQDTFTGTNGTAILSHTPDIGPSWTEHAGIIGSTRPTIQSNKLQAPSNGGSFGYYANLSAADVTLDLTGTPGIDNTRLGFICRYSDDSNYWRAYATIFAGGGSSSLEFTEINGGSFTQRGFAHPSANISSTSPINVHLVLIGTSLTLSIGA